MKNYRKSRVRGLAYGVLATSLMAVGGVAHAVPVTSISNMLNFSWSYNTGTSLLTGFGSMTVTGFNSNTLSIAVSLTNTSLLGGNGGERLTGFGFGIDPDADSVTFQDADDQGMIAATMDFIPGYNHQVEICAWGGENCKGGSNGGIYGGGGSDSFTLLLGTEWGDTVNIDPIAFKYQTGYGSFEFTSSSSSSSSSSGRQVPEPTTLSLLGAGLLGIALAYRHRRKQQAAA